MERLIIYFITTMLFTQFCYANDKEFEWTNDVGARQFPANHKVYDVNNYGAIGDSKLMCTKAIQSAIDECESNGGGIVTFGPGIYLCGSIFIGNNVNLVIPKGTTLIGSDSIKDYKTIQTRVAGIEMMWPAALINIISKKNAAISGEGTIDGRGNLFWDLYWKMQKEYENKGLRWIVDYDCQRPRGILVSNSIDVTLKDFVLYRPGFWSVHILYSDHVTVERIIIANNIGGKGPSTDGIDIDSSSKILVQGCDINCNDDNICLKAGRDADGLRVNKPCEFVLIRNCTTGKGDGLITIGSETSGGIRNILISDMKAKETYYGIRFKSTSQRGGIIENIYISNIQMDKVIIPFFVDLNWFPAYSNSILPPAYSYQTIPSHWKKLLEKVDSIQGLPKFKNIHIENLKASNAKICLNAKGLKNSTLDKFNLKNIVIEGDEIGLIENTCDWIMENVVLKSHTNDKIALVNNRRMIINEK